MSRARIDAPTGRRHLKGVKRFVLAASFLVFACDDPKPPTPEPTPEPKAEATAAPTATASEAPAALAPPPAPSAAPIASEKPEPKTEPAPEKTAVKPTATTKAPAPEKSAAPAEPERKVTTVSGGGAAGEGFALGISARSPVRAGESGAATIVLNAKSPYKCNAKYPYKMALDAPVGGISYPSTVVKGMNIADKTSTMSVPFSATAKGKATISGTFSFSVCTDDKCLIEKRKLAVTIDVD